MGLADRLIRSEDLSRPDSADESEFVPARVDFDGSRGVLDTGSIKGAIPADMTPIFRDCLINAGYDPDKVRIGKQIRESHWQQRARKRVWSEPHTAFIHTHDFETI